MQITWKMNPVTCLFWNINQYFRMDRMLSKVVLMGLSPGLPESRRTPKQNIGNCRSIILVQKCNWSQEEEETNTLELITPSSLHYKYRVWGSWKALNSLSNLEGAFQGNGGFSPPQTFSEDYDILQCVHVALARRKGIKRQLFPCLLRFLAMY